MTSVLPTLCQACTRLGAAGDTCEAFPAGIPAAILVYGADHRTPVDGDHGIVFAAADGKEEELATWLKYMSPEAAAKAARAGQK